MKGLKTILGIALATTGFSGAVAVGAVSVSHSEQQNIQEAKASVAAWSQAFVIGNWDGTNWTARELTYNSTKKRYETTISNVTAGTQYKYASKSDWNGENVARNWDGVSSDGVLSSVTYATGENFTIRAAGTYTFYVDSWLFQAHDNAGYGVHIECEYSYFIAAANKEYTKIHLWNSNSDTYTAWDSDPTIASLGGGQAYNVRWSNNNYSLYRIPHPLLTAYKYCILRDSSSQTGDTTITSVTGAGFINLTSTSATFSNTSSNNYLAAKIAYEAVCHRGQATYKNTSLNYSVCATSAEDAQAVIDMYDGTTSAVRTVLDSVTVEVYKVSGTISEYTKEYVKISNVVDAMRIIVQNNSSASGSLKINAVITNNSPILIVVITSIIVSTFVGYMIIRKRKHQ